MPNLSLFFVWILIRAFREMLAMYGLSLPGTQHGHATPVRIPQLMSLRGRAVVPSFAP